MVSKFALLSNILLISAALAVPPLQPGARLTRDGLQHSTPDAESMPTKNWAGASMLHSPGAFVIVTAAFNVPSISGRTGGIVAWVGINGTSCPAILQAGIRARIVNGIPLYEVWYEWYPAEPAFLVGKSIEPGDVITVTIAITSESATTGIVIIMRQGANPLDDWIVSSNVASSYPLCGNNAEWIVERYKLADGSYYPFANFGMVTFTHALASGPHGNAHTPFTSTSTIYDIVDGREFMTTSIAITGRSIFLNIRYVSSG